MRNNYVSFEEGMKKEYTILVPDMLPRHFKLLSRVMGNFGYRMELLTTSGKEIADTGLKYVHNDTCYPAILVIGQFIHALQSGKYDVHKTALILTQTGGGCRASNYIHLLRKALEKAGLGFVPVISLNFSGLEKHPGFRLTLPLLVRMVYSVLYGDLLMALVNQCKPYERVPGATERLADEWTARLAEEMKEKSKINYKKVLANYQSIVSDFSRLERTREEKPRVGIVGEIYVKYSPMANNHLENFLLREGAEPVVPGLLDFCLYCVFNMAQDCQRYGLAKTLSPVFRLALHFLENKQKDLLEAIKAGGFRALSPFSHTASLAKGTISHGVKMGEGWLLTAEMLELYECGVNNVVCAQPFGCLPNHICGKGVSKQIMETHPGMNIVPIDYDAGATQVNQENRLKLMLATASRRSQGGSHDAP